MQSLKEQNPINPANVAGVTEPQHPFNITSYCEPFIEGAQLFTGGPTHQHAAVEGHGMAAVENFRPEADRQTILWFTEELHAAEDAVEFGGLAKEIKLCVQLF